LQAQWPSCLLPFLYRYQHDLATDQTAITQYLCSLVVDEGHIVISHVQADFADRCDSTLLPRIIDPLHQRLLAHELPVGEVIADSKSRTLTTPTG
jgi:hypothetical protein